MYKVKYIMKKGKTTLILTFALVLSIMVGYFSISYAMDNDLFRQENYKINEKGELIMPTIMRL